VEIEKETAKTASGVRRGARRMSPASAALRGLLDRLDRGERVPGLAADERIEGRVCLVTGANGGLGRAVAVQLARRGGHVIMACRSGIPEAGESVKRESGSDAVEMMHVDLADLASVQRLCDSLRERKVRLDIAILNAGLMPRRARSTAQGFEVMFAVHFLANRLLVSRLIEGGTIPAEGERPGARPRIVFVSSESHRSAPPIAFERFGEFVDYGLRDGMDQYGRSKLHTSTLASELSRRLDRGGDVRVAVHSLCPGPVASNIAREAPALVKPFLSALMRLAFRSPAAAAEPVVYLACARQLEGRTGVYLHMMREKTPGAEATDPEKGRLLWEKSAELLRPYLR
jgi:NAD(P)-dependent dehydrogenase (short-subunit alcohol dehydrogenase family)